MKNSVKVIEVDVDSGETGIDIDFQVKVDGKKTVVCHRYIVRKEYGEWYFGSWKEDPRVNQKEVRSDSFPEDVWRKLWDIVIEITENHENGVDVQTTDKSAKLRRRAIVSARKYGFVEGYKTGQCPSMDDMSEDEKNAVMIGFHQAMIRRNQESIDALTIDESTDRASEIAFILEVFPEWRIDDDNVRKFMEDMNKDK